MRIASHTFSPKDLVAGDTVLDFVNTVTARDQPQPVDWLSSYAAVIDWAGHSGRFERNTLRRLSLMARKQPGLAEKALDRARRLREAIHVVVSSRIDARKTPKSAIDELEGQWKEACVAARLGLRDGRLEPEHPARSLHLDTLRYVLAMDAVDAIGEFDVARLRRCQGSYCGWLFIDTSKAGRRCWCDMATCGNAAKARRHRGRGRVAD